MNTNKHGFAVAGLVLGIVSVVFACCYGAGLVTGIVGLVLAALAKKEGNTESMNTAGLVLNIIAVALNILAFILIVIIGVAGGLASYMPK